MQKPETKLIKKVQRILKELEPSLEHWKHADKFNAGIADVHMIMASGIQAWVEFKWVPSITRYRAIDVTELQKIFLEDHASRQIPAYVMVGSPKGLLFYHISDHSGTVVADSFGDMRTTCQAFINLLKEGSWHYRVECGMWKILPNVPSVKASQRKTNSTSR